MPFVSGRFYVNPVYGRALEAARAADAALQHHESDQQEQDAHWVTIDGRHVLIQEKEQTRPQRRPRQFSGDATYYNLPGKKTANGEKFDPNKMAAAITAEKAKLGQTVTVTYTYRDQQGNSRTRTISVVVNDRGPFARDPSGKAQIPLQPAAGRVIDLTPAAFNKLVGTTNPGHVPVTVTVPND